MTDEPEPTAEQGYQLTETAESELEERFGARRVVLFGSLARGTAHESSDVDLAVEGIPPERFFAAAAELVGLFDSPVDLVEIEQASPGLKARLRQAGRELSAGGGSAACSRVMAGP